MIKAVIFDIDGTLAPGVSWTALTRELGADPAVHERIWADFQAGHISYDESRRRLLALWRATGHADKRHLVQLFRHWPLHRAAPQVVRAVQKLGYRPCLITGSLDLFAAAIAVRLGVEDWYANTILHFNDAGDLVSYDYEPEQAGKKLQQLEYFCTKYRLRASECVAVGDSDNDLQLFRRLPRSLLLEAEGQSAELQDAAWRTVGRLSDVTALLESLS